MPSLAVAQVVYKLLHQRYLGIFDNDITSGNSSSSPRAAQVEIIINDFKIVCQNYNIKRDSGNVSMTKLKH